MLVQLTIIRIQLSIYVFLLHIIAKTLSDKHVHHATLDNSLTSSASIFMVAPKQHKTKLICLVPVLHVNILWCYLITLVYVHQVAILSPINAQR